MPLRKVIQHYSCNTAYVLLLALVVKGHNVNTNVYEGNTFTNVFEEPHANEQFNNVYKVQEHFDNVSEASVNDYNALEHFDNVSEVQCHGKSVWKSFAHFTQVYKVQEQFDNVSEASVNDYNALEHSDNVSEVQHSDNVSKVHYHGISVWKSLAHFKQVVSAE